MSTNHGYQSLRWRLALILVGSALLAIAVTGLLLMLAMVLAQVALFRWLLDLLAQTVGPVPVMLAVGLLLFFVFYVLLSQPTIQYIEAMSRAMNQVARGDFDVALPKRAPDELGLLGENMVAMSQQLKASIAKERQANQARQELITSVSHDLRTPLTSILGYLQLIDQDRYKDEVELRYYVDVAYEKGKQLKRRIDQLFEFTRTSHGGISLRPVEINLGELLEQLAEEFVPALRAAGMEYRLSLPPERISLKADPDLLVRLLENLIVNGIRYGQEGEVVELELESTGGAAVIRVATWGNPIPNAALPLLFDTFYRVESSRSEKTGGAGLGLAIAKNIVTLHGGSIRAFNEHERTVFEVRLPRGGGVTTPVQPKQ